MEPGIYDEAYMEPFCSIGFPLGWLSEDSVDWFSLIWYSLAVPKHAFIAWLAMKNALAIGNKLHAALGFYRGCKV